MRHTTFNLGHGIGKIRWCDDHDTVRSLYPHSVQTQRTRVTIPRFMRATGNVSMTAELVFGPEGVVEMTLSPALERRIPNWSSEKKAAASQLATLFDLPSGKTSWRIEEATVTLDEGWDDFTLHVHPVH